MSPSWLFLRHFMRSPVSIGSIMPSSRYLVAAMVHRVDWQQANVVIELGAGTGVITQEINDLRRRDSMFLSFEYEDSMRADLTRRFSSVGFCKDAFRLKEEMAGVPSGKGADCVISGLPFANFSPLQRDQLLADIHAALNPGGLFVAFQYTRQLQPFLVSSFDEFNSQKVWANIPPAFVYLCRKAPLNVS